MVKRSDWKHQLSKYSQSNWWIYGCKDYSYTSKVYYTHNGVQSRLYVRLSVYLSLRLSVSLYLCTVACVTFWRSNRAARNCVQRMRPQATGSNPLSVSIICPSVRPVARETFAFYLFIFLSSVGVHRRDWFISRDKEINERKKKRRRSQGGDIIRLLGKKYLEGKWLTIYVNEGKHLPYW